VEPLVSHPTANLKWLLLGYPLIIGLYGVENVLRRQHYGRDVRRTIPIGGAFLAYVLLLIIYELSRRWLEPIRIHSHDLLWLNGVTLTVVMVVMWAYRRFNDYYKGLIR
jgi:hypothetical protein